MEYDEVQSDFPSVLFHVAPGDCLDDILKNGIRNKKTKIVFLTNSFRYIDYFFSLKKEPVLLRVDVKAMLCDGYKFYRNSLCDWMIITECILPEYISVIDFDNNADMI